MLKRIFVQLVCSYAAAGIVQRVTAAVAVGIFFSLSYRGTVSVRLLLHCVPWLSVLCYVVKCTILCIVVVLVYLENSIRSFSSCLTSFMGATD